MQAYANEQNTATETLC